MECKLCGDRFDAPGGVGRPRQNCYRCSPYQPSTYKKRPKTSKVCSICGVSFETARPHATTCSKVCSKEKSRAFSRGYYYRVRTPHVARKTAICKSPKCRNKFTTGHKRFFCSRKCRMDHRNAIRPGASLRRRIAQYGAKSEPVDRLVVFNRDKWVCRLCGKRTIRSRLGQRHPKAPTLDHVTPLSKGGSHTYDNLQCAHLRCNMDKGNRV